MLLYYYILRSSLFWPIQKLLCFTAHLKKIPAIWMLKLKFVTFSAWIFPLFNTFIAKCQCFSDYLLITSIIMFNSDPHHVLRGAVFLEFDRSICPYQLLVFSLFLCSLEFLRISISSDCFLVNVTVAKYSLCLFP